MAARVAHEIRTPLSTIRGLLELLQGDQAPGGFNQEYMKRIIQAVDRQDRLVENLLTLSNPEPYTCQAVSLPALIDDVLAMRPPNPRVRVTGSSALAVGTTLGLVLTLRNTQQVPLTLDLRLGTPAEPPAEGVIPLRTWTWPPRLIIRAVAAEGEVLGPEGQTRVYLLFDRRP